MLEFLAGLVVGGYLGVFVVALCVAAARGERDDG
jgi:gas vesicle protein